MDFYLNQLKDKVMPLLEAHHYQLYKLLLVPLKRRLLIRVFIENDAGITVGDCEKVSRLINDMIFTENLVESAYVLEVSSPGIDRPLEKLKDFQRNIGRKLRVLPAIRSGPFSRRNIGRGCGFRNPNRPGKERLTKSGILADHQSECIT